MSQKLYLWILKIGVGLTLLTPFFLFNDLLFPYITSKQLPFNILIEVLTIFWLGLIVKYPEYRPKRNWITFGLLGFFAALIVSALIGVDVNLSFWGDIERMLGVFGLLHFLMLYFIVITAFRNEQEWQTLIVALVGTASLEGLYAVANISKNNYGTLGNSSYVSGQMIFGLFFALYLLYKHKNIGVRLAYLFGMIFMFLAFVNAGTRGAYIGLVFGLATIAFLLALLGKNKKVRIGSVALVSLLVIGSSLIFSNTQSSWVQGSRFFRRIAEINFQTATFQTRLLSWQTAFKDFPNHPFFGTGYGNFAITFDKYLDPKFFSYEATYFDHAHNNLVDILTTTGAVGLITYLSIFVALLFYIIKAYREKTLGLVEFAIIIGLVVAYFVQNLVLFDSFITYLGLMILFGFVYWLSHRQQLQVSQPSADLSNKELAVLSIAGVLLVILMWQANFKVWSMLQQTIGGQIIYSQSGDIKAAVEAYKKALSQNTVLDRDSRTSLLQLVPQAGASLQKLNEADANEVFAFLFELAEKNLAYNPKDSFNLMIYAQVSQAAANYYGQAGNQTKYQEYSSKTEKLIDLAIESNPARPSNYYLKAQLYLQRGEKDKALDILNQAVALNPDFAESNCQLARTALYLDKKKEGYLAMDSCIDHGGANYFGVEQLSGLAQHYYETKDFARTIKLYEQIGALQPKDGRVWAGLADLYRRIGEKDKAIEAATRAGEIDPALKESADQFIKGLQ